MFLIACILVIANLVYWGRQGPGWFFLSLFFTVVGFLIFK